MFSFFSKQKSAICLDISENTLRILQLQKTKDGIFPVAFFEQNLKKGIIEDGNVKNAEELSKNIVKAMRRPAYGKFDSQYVVISLPDSKSFVRVISVPKMSEEEAKETVPLEAEEKIKQQNGLLGLKSGKQIKEILDPPLRSLVEAIKNSINFYQEHSDGSRNINKILLSGGGSKLKGLREYLNSQLKPVGQISGDFVEIGDPWINVLDSKSGKVPPISKLDSVSYVTSIGLALRGLDME